MRIGRRRGRGFQPAGPGGPIFLLVLACAAWTSGALADGETPAATGDFVAYCQANFQACEDQVTSAAVTLIMTHNQDFCDPSNDYPEDLTNAVIGWLNAHPQTRGEPISKSLPAALLATRPCPSN